METKLIIPTHDNDGTDNSTVVEGAIRALCAQFGGATVYAAKGYWLNEEGRLYQDDVAVIVSAATEAGGAREALRDLARDVLDATDQEAVFISVGGDAEIIE